MKDLGQGYKIEMSEIIPEHMKFTIPQLKELERIDRIRDIVINMREEIE